MTPGYWRRSRSDTAKAFEKYLLTNPPFAEAASIVGDYFDLRLYEGEYDLTTGKRELLQRFNGDTGMMERKLSNVTRAMNQEHLSDALIDLIEASGIGNHPEFILRLDTRGAEIALAESETRGEAEAGKRLEEYQKQQAEEAKDPRAQAQRRIEEIRQDPRYIEGDSNLVAEMQRLYRITTGDAVHFDPNTPTVIPLVPQDPEPYISNRAAMHDIGTRGRGAEAPSTPSPERPEPGFNVTIGGPKGTRVIRNHGEDE
jgi:hypothetical protein